MKLMGIIVMLVMTVVTARSCSGGSSGNSPLDPTNLARNGIAGVCADQQAVADDGDGSGGSTAGGTAVSPSQLSQLSASNPGGVQALSQALGGNFSCPTTTVDNGLGG